MNGEFSRPERRGHQSGLAHGIDRTIAAFSAAMKVLNEKQFAAPWRVPQTCESNTPC